MAQRGIVKNGLSADIAAEHHAALFSTMYGKSGICSGFNELACTKVDNNTVRLASGVYSLSGYALMVDPGTAEDLTIDSGTSGQSRNDLIVAEFIRNGESVGNDTLHFTVVKGTSTSGTAADPALTQQDINAAGVTRQEALYRVKVVGTEITAVEKLAGSVSNLNLVWSRIYPVGSLFETTDETFNPASVWGGTWELYGAGRVTVGYSSGETEFNAGGKTGGAKTHTLTTAEIPVSNLKQAIATAAGTPGYFPVVSMTEDFGPGRLQVDGGNGAHNNLQPYITVFRWRRTA